MTKNKDSINVINNLNEKSLIKEFDKLKKDFTDKSFQNIKLMEKLEDLSDL